MGLRSGAVSTPTMIAQQVIWNVKRDSLLWAVDEIWKNFFVIMINNINRCLHSQPINSFRVLNDQRNIFVVTIQA